MVVKVVFIGNPLGGDDGIGPRLFRELSGRPELAGYELYDLGVAGLDLLNHVESGDQVIIVDAIVRCGSASTNPVTDPADTATVPSTKTLEALSQGVGRASGPTPDYEIGRVLVLPEGRIAATGRPLSLHDIGVEEAISLLRLYVPDLAPIVFIGITVESVDTYTTELSASLQRRLPHVTKEVLQAILATSRAGVAGNGRPERGSERRSKRKLNKATRNTGRGDVVGAVQRL